MGRVLTENFRYERKFITNRFSFYEVQRIVKMNPIMFREIYYPRYVNNIYFDTVEMDCYFSNVKGYSEREKLRLRWYGDMINKKTENAQFEMKIKENMLNTKNIFELKDSLDTLNIANSITNIIKNKLVSDDFLDKLKLTRPVLSNRYLRQYFLSPDSKYRLTIDTEIQVNHIDSKGQLADRDKTLNKFIIVELKYAAADDIIVDKISSQFPFRLNRNSKYVNGIMDLLNNGYL